MRWRTLEEHKKLILKTCVLAGKIMMENGSEVYRVEDTMNRIATNAGAVDCVSYVTATGLFIGFKEDSYCQLEEVHERAINLEKVVAVNRLSRQFAEGELSLAELYDQLLIAKSQTPSFRLSTQTFSAGIVSCTLMYIFGGSWTDFTATFVIGALGFLTAYLVKKWLQISFLDMFAAAVLIGVLSVFCSKLGLAKNVDNLIIGAVMPLVPGVAITNSFRDIMAGDLISGTARGIEAIFTAAAIGMGIAFVLSLSGGAF